jgi:hypothetical protein
MRPIQIGHEMGKNIHYYKSRTWGLKLHYINKKFGYFHWENLNTQDSQGKIAYLGVSLGYVLADLQLSVYQGLKLNYQSPVWLLSL